MRTTGISAGAPERLFEVVRPLVSGQRAFGASSQQGQGNVTITVAPAGPCYAFVMAQVDTWGYAGGEATLSIEAPEGLSQVAYHEGRMIRGDQIRRPLLSWGVWSGLVGGSDYAFAVSGSNLGTVPPIDAMAICI